MQKRVVKFEKCKAILMNLYSNWKEKQAIFN